MNNKFKTSFFSFILTVFSVCSQNDDYLLPQKIADGITVGSANEYLDTTLISDLISDIDSGKYQNMHSVLVLRNNKLIVEKYFEGYHKDSLHQLRSISKCITSILLGIAVDKGFIKSVDESIFNYLPEYRYLKNEKNKKITVHHLASMSTGLSWNESDISYNDENNDENRMYEDGDWVGFTLKKEVIAEPGKIFNYSGGVTNVLAAVIQNAVKMPLDEFAEKYLFLPLEIDNFIWRKNRDRTLVSANAGLRIKPRDMIKIGAMLLNNGVWNKKQVVSKVWVKKLSSKQVSGGPLGPFNLSYGYTVLVVEKGPDFFPKLKGYAATGNGGQIIWVLPEHDTVFVMNGGNYNSDLSQTQPIEIVLKYLYPSLKK